MKTTDKKNEIELENGKKVSFKYIIEGVISKFEGRFNCAVYAEKNVAVVKDKGSMEIIIEDFIRMKSLKGKIYWVDNEDRINRLNIYCAFKMTIDKLELEFYTKYSFEDSSWYDLELHDKKKM